MKKLQVVATLFIISIIASSCFKKWTCECTAYKLSFSDSFVSGNFKTDTTIITQTTETFGAKKKAKTNCDNTENDNKTQANSIGANPNDIGCILR